MNGKKYKINDWRKSTHDEDKIKFFKTNATQNATNEDTNATQNATNEDVQKQV